MITRILMLAVLCVLVIPAQTITPPAVQVEFQYDVVSIPTDFIVQNGLPVFTAYQRGVILQAWAIKGQSEINAFVAVVLYRVPGTTKLLSKSIVFPMNPTSGQGSASMTFDALDFEIYTVFMSGTKNIGAMTSAIHPVPGVRYPGIR